MKIIFDFDGVLTDFNKFVKQNAITFFKKKYGMDVINPYALEIEDIFEIQNVLKKSGCSEQEALNIQKRMLNHFWVSYRFIKFSLMDRFRTGVKEYIHYLKQQGFCVEIHSSRSKTCEKNLIGIIARQFSIWQCRLNGIFIPKKQIHFYPNDEEKLKGILNLSPLIIFEDKPWMIEMLSKAGMKIICVSNIYNQNIVSSQNIEIIKEFNTYLIEQKVEHLLGKKNYTCHKKEANSAKFFRRLIKARIFVPLMFHPIILHPENIFTVNTEGIIYAPNHRSTLDPMIVESILKENIHWAALQRFFIGEDSIFNNSKNIILCNITKYMFKKLEYFPIERRSENKNANNLKSLKDMDLFLKNRYKIGIFAEGTTNRLEDEDFGKFDDTFLRLAKKNHSWIQPITLFWVEKQNSKNKVIINFGKAFQIGNMSIDESMEHFLNIQRASLRECMICRQNKSNMMKEKRVYLYEYRFRHR